MAQAVIMPRQGQSVENCIITSWAKKVGDRIAIGDILFSYETDKSTFDEPAQTEGTLLAILANEGDVVPCLENVCVIGNEGEDISEFLKKDAVDEKKDDEEKEVKKEAVSVEVTVDTSGDDRIKISPRAKSLALKSGVDMTKVKPSGPNGRIIERDINTVLDAGYKSTIAAVEDYLAGKVTAAAETEEATAQVAVQATDDLRAYTEAPMTPIRNVIAERMHASLSEMAQLTMNTSFDATSLMNYRAMLKKGGESLGLGKITINDMIMFAVSRVLPNHPVLNAALVDGKIRTYNNINLGVAVDTDRGLLVPVVFGAQKKTLSEISKDTKAKAEAARNGNLPKADMSDGSFTVTNLGSMGIESFTPVINPPQVAILGVCGSVNRIRDDGTVYPAMGLSLTIDHRAVDGTPAARFLVELKNALENFDLLLAK